MKIILILAGLISFGLVGRTQNFFYIDNKNPTEKSIRQQLIKASQYVTQSPLASDYIITASAEVESGTQVFSLIMTMQDTLTYKTIFQSREDYVIRQINLSTPVFLRMTLAGFIEKNIGQIIVCARDDHFNTQSKFLKARKDKT